MLNVQALHASELQKVAWCHKHSMAANINEVVVGTHAVQGAALARKNKC